MCTYDHSRSPRPAQAKLTKSCAYSFGASAAYETSDMQGKRYPGRSNVPTNCGTPGCRLKPFVKLARTIRAQRPGIEAAIQNGLSNARVEQINTQIRLITRRGFGYHSQQAVIALAMLSLSDLCPPLPGR